jgi:hypothetical protein
LTASALLFVLLVAGEKPDTGPVVGDTRIDAHKLGKLSVADPRDYDTLKWTFDEAALTIEEAKEGWHWTGKPGVHKVTLSAIRKGKDGGKPTLETWKIELVVGFKSEKN